MENPSTAKEIVLSLKERFLPEKAENYDAIFHLDISGDNGGQFSVIIKDQTCEVKEGFEGDPACFVKAKDKVYEDVELGRTNAQMALLMGKLKISDIGAMLDFIGLFNRLDKE